MPLSPRCEVQGWYGRAIGRLSHGDLSITEGSQFLLKGSFSEAAHCLFSANWLAAFNAAHESLNFLQGAWLDFKHQAGLGAIRTQYHES